MISSDPLPKTLPLHSLIGALLIVTPSARANDSTQALFESWRWIRYTTQSGLPSNHVDAVIETPAGTVWAVTDAGLAWFDGYQWLALDPASELANLTPDMVTADRSEGLVVVAGHRLYRGGKNGFRRVSIASNSRQMLVTSAVAFLGDSLLIITEDAETKTSSIWIEQNGDIKRAPAPPRFQDLIEPRLWRTCGGTVWLSAGSHLYSWSDGQWKLRLDTGDAAARIDLIAEDAKAGGLVSFRFPAGRSGLAEWDGDGDFQMKDEFRYYDFISIDVDSAGTAYALEGGGLLWIRDGLAWRILDPVPPELYSINFLKVRPNGDLWIGSKSGLLLHRRSDCRWTHWRHGDGRLEDQIAEILGTSDGSVWLGTGNGVEIRRPDGTVENIKRIGDTDLGRIIGIAEDSDGDIWISSGFSFSGAFRWDGRQWRHFGPDDGLQAPYVHKIRKDRDGRLWFLGIGQFTGDKRDAGPGAFLYADGQFERWGPDEGLINGRVYAVAQTSDRALWFGTARGISRWRHGTWKHWQTEDGLRTNRVFTMAADHHDTVWFGHQRSGLGFIGASDKPSYLTTADGLVDNRVWDLQVDSHDRLWISTDDGFSCFVDGSWSNYTTDDGLSSARLFPIHPFNDKIYVGTRSAGTSILDLSAVQDLPRIIFEPVILDGTTALVQWSAYSFDGLIAPEKIITRYRLDDDAWSPWSKAREFTKENLLYGHRSVTVQAKGFSPNFDAAGETLSFEVLQPIHLRTAVVLPVLLFVLSLIGLSVYLLIRRRVHAVALMRERSLAEAKFRFIAEGTAAATGRDFFQSLVRHLALAIDVRYAFLTERLKSEEERLQTVAFWNGEGFAEKIAYDPKGKPCECVLRGEERYYPEHLTELFPNAKALARLHAQSFLGVPIRKSTGEIIGHLGVMHVDRMSDDPSRLGIMRVFATRAAAELERRDTDVELQHAKEAAEAADRAKSAFLRNVNHEIRTPIMAMLGATELIQSTEERSNGQLDFREVALRNGRHLVALVDDLLNAGRMESGRIDVNVGDCPLCEVLADVNASISTVKRHTEVEFKIILESEIPSVIRSDAIRLRQALINLVNNAFKFTHEGHVHVVVRVDSHEGKFTLSIRVEDTGRGIAKEDQQRIFSPFTQLGPSVDEGTAGMGLGLPLARSIAEQLGGSLEVESEAGVGSTFLLKLPLDPVHDADWIEPNAFVSSLFDSREKQVWLSGRVLIAEDFRDTRELLQYALSKAGAEVTAVDNGLAAVEAAASDNFDLIILDIRMPKMDGLSAAAALRRQGIRVPVIALTASVGPNALDRVLEAGFDDMWSKPMTLESVISSAADYLPNVPSVEQSPETSMPAIDNSRFAVAVSGFVQSLGPRMEKLRTCVEAGDVKGAREILHQLVGAGGLHGYMNLSTEAARLQEMAKNDSLAHKTSELHVLEEIVASTDEQVEHPR